MCVSGGSIYIAELGTHSGVHGFGQWKDYSQWTPNIGNVISILNPDGSSLHRCDKQSPTQYDFRVAMTGACN